MKELPLYCIVFIVVQAAYKYEPVLLCYQSFDLLPFVLNHVASLSFMFFFLAGSVLLRDHI